MLTTERLLDDRWEGKLYSGGWTEGGGDALAVRDKWQWMTLRDAGAAYPF